MGRRIVSAFALIEPPADYSAVLYNDRPDRDLSDRFGPAGQVQGLFHPVAVVMHVCSPVSGWKPPFTSIYHAAALLVMNVIRIRDRREPYRTETAGAHGQMWPKSTETHISIAGEQAAIAAEAEALS